MKKEDIRKECPNCETMVKVTGYDVGWCDKCNANICLECGDDVMNEDACSVCYEDPNLEEL